MGGYQKWRVSRLKLRNCNVRNAKVLRNAIFLLVSSLCQGRHSTFCDVTSGSRVSEEFVGHCASLHECIRCADSFISRGVLHQQNGAANVHESVEWSEGLRNDVKYHVVDGGGRIYRRGFVLGSCCSECRDQMHMRKDTRLCTAIQVKCIIHLFSGLMQFSPIAGIARSLRLGATFGHEHGEINSL